MSRWMCLLHSKQLNGSYYNFFKWSSFILGFIISLFLYTGPRISSLIFIKFFLCGAIKAFKERVQLLCSHYKNTHCKKIFTLQRYILQKMKVPLFKFVRNHWEQVGVYTCVCLFYYAHMYVYKFIKSGTILYVVLKLAFSPLYILDLFPSQYL